MRHTPARIAAVAIAITALGAPAAANAKVIGGGGSPPQDLRSPDARDAAEGRGTFNAPDVVVVSKQSDAPAATNDGIDWADVGIGGGAMGAIVLIASGGVLVARRRSTAAV
jgi:hypothetical protein